jgi:5-methylcytosine-specific restriction endonuclease McrA
MIKPCPKCGSERTITGSRPYCSPCETAANKRRYFADPEPRRAYGRQYSSARYHADPEKGRTQSRVIGKKSRDKKRAYFLACRADWEARHPELVRLIAAEIIAEKKYRERLNIAAHRQLPEIQAKNQEWRKANRERRAVYVATWKKQNRGRCNAHARKRQAAKSGNVTADDQAVAVFYEHVRSAKRIVCYYCQRPVPKGKRHVDHVIPLAKEGPHSTANLCCSCSACNLKKAAKLPDAMGLLPL